MSGLALEIRDVCKTYNIVDAHRRPANLLEALAQRARHPLSNNIGTERFVALDGVTLDVEQGEIFGLIGHNGAGKSTLLKVLTRITGIDAGFIRVAGRVGSLIEVGTGFHPDLTGRENIFLNGAILGMRRAEIAKKLDSIVDFAELSAFLETPVKRYSSGMAVRLAFSVAVHLAAEILLIDEVLAVGDADFQEKCITKMDEIVADQGRTVVVVGHNMGTVRRLCNRVALLERGRLVTVGPPAEVTQRYLQTPLEVGIPGMFDLTEGHSGPLVGLSIKGPDGYPCADLEMGQPARFDLSLGDVGAIDRPAVAVRISLDDGTSVSTFLAPTDLLAPARADGTRSLSLNIRSLPLTPGRYYLDLAVRSLANGTAAEEIPRAASFMVTSRRGDATRFRALHGDGIVTMDSAWTT